MSETERRSVLVLVFTSLWRPLSWVEWVILVFYGAYFAPYIAISFYDRYALPMLGVIVRRQDRSFRRAERLDSNVRRFPARSPAAVALSILAAVSMTVLAVVTHESRIAGSDPSV